MLLSRLISILLRDFLRLSLLSVGVHLCWDRRVLGRGQFGGLVYRDLRRIGQ